MVVLICRAHHSASNNHSFINLYKHEIPLSVRALDKVLSKEQALYFVLTHTDSLVCLHQTPRLQ